MMKAAMAGAEAGAKGQSREPPRVIAVTILTSHAPRTVHTDLLLREDYDIPTATEMLSLHAMEAGLLGVVCSAQEAETNRAVLGPDKLIVTPGIRTMETDDDQARPSSPTQALRNGSDILVVGRPIVQASDPARATKALLAMMECA